MCSLTSHQIHLNSKKSTVWFYIHSYENLTFLYVSFRHVVSFFSSLSALPPALSPLSECAIFSWASLRLLLTLRGIFCIMLDSLKTQPMMKHENNFIIFWDSDQKIDISVFTNTHLHVFQDRILLFHWTFFYQFFNWLLARDRSRISLSYFILISQTVCDPHNHTSVLHCEISISVTRFCLSGREIIKTAFSFVQDIFSIMKTIEILLIRVRILFSLPT